MNENNIISEKDIYKLIREDENLYILEESEDGRFIILEDEEDAKEFAVHFLEKMNPEKLAELIHISPDIPEEYKIDKLALAEYLWNSIDKNMFLTLNELVLVWNDGERDDSELKRLYEETSDEFALFLSEGNIGQLWFDQNIAAINLYELMIVSKEIEEANSDLYDPFFHFENQMLTGLLTTAIHEIRHLGLETNIFLPEEQYPYSLNAEAEVENYCLDIFMEHPVPQNIIVFKEQEQSVSMEEKSEEDFSMDNAEKIIDISQVGFRTESFSGLNERIAAEVMAYEVFELDNSDILETLRDGMLKSSDFSDKLDSFIDELDREGFIDDMSFEDAVQFFEDVLAEIETITGEKPNYALWLTDIDTVLGFYGKYITSVDDIDCYQKSSIVLSEISDGNLYGYRNYPEALNLEEYLEIKNYLTEKFEDHFKLKDEYFNKFLERMNALPDFEVEGISKDSLLQDKASLEAAAKKFQDLIINYLYSEKGAFVEAIDQVLQFNIYPLTQKSSLDSRITAAEIRKESNAKEENKILQNREKERV